MKNYLYAFLVFLLLHSCNDSVNKMDTDTYEKASGHLSRNLNKYVSNIVLSQKWVENKLFYRLKTEDGINNYSVNPIDGEIREEVTYPTSKSINKKPNEYVSPDGNLAAYIDNYNLWVRNLYSNKKTQLTFDGYEDYGYSTNNAGWIKNDGPVLKWSPNSDKIATFRQDARKVGEMYLTTTNVGHPNLQKWKYALPGDENIFEIERLIVDLKSKKIIPLKIKNDFQRSTTTDHIAGRNGVLLDTQWKDDGSELAFISSTRDHKEAHLQIANSKTGFVKSIHRETTETYYESGVRGENWRVLFDSNEFIWYSEKDNWGHLYLYDLKSGELKNQITQGKWLVRTVLHIDENERKIFFTAGGKEEGNPYHVYLYKVNFDGTELECLTPEKGTHNVTPSEDWSYFTTTFSTTNNPPKTLLKNRSGDVLKELASADISQLLKNNWQKPIEFSVKARDNETDIYGLLYLPSFYNENHKYPVLNYIYPGPQSGSIGNYSFSVARRDFQALAELGFVVLGVDAMGTPGRSKSFHDAYYGNMGDNGLPDNIKAIKDLSKEYKGMDIDRVGIWGHSGGGFASTRAILQYPDFYDVAVSSSGNHDNRNYEADWAEKWQGLLKYIDDDSSDGEKNYDFRKTNYDNQANQLLAKNLKGKLLLAHGNLDDNVPPYSTLLVVDALIKENKDFDLIIFPNKRHGYGDMNNYFTRRKWDYFVKNLKGLEPPKNFKLGN